ncbi:MAG: hypothetical protein JSW39_03105 [Desulfobacterales bacterium]|nr:MAG: hypothetical protein JSW39_03105 [Desulfobacterales bacterium]
MLDVDDLIHQIRRNCDISDAQHAGLYSICGLALRLRDLYKWEKSLAPWEEGDSAEVLEWIGDKEQQWEKLAATNYRQLSIRDRSFDPFDTAGINAALESEGLFYGAGYARSLKPTFFLALIEDKRQIEGYTVYFLGRELARDLLTLPALAQDQGIVVRQESAKLYVWDQILYMKKSGRAALQFALENCGLTEQTPQALRPHLTTILAAQRDNYIYHEIGELRDTIFDRTVWREVIAAYPHSPVELLARAVKDLLADTNASGTLRHIIQARQKAALAFYVAFCDGLALALFPELIDSFREFTRKHRWQVIDHAVTAGHNTARQYAEAIIDIHQAGRGRHDVQWTVDEIEKRLGLASLIAKKG